MAVLLAICLAAPAVAQQPLQQTAELSPEQWTRDLTALMQGLEKTHKNMHHATPRTDFDTAAANLSARIPSLQRHEIIAGMMRIVAMVGDGHTNIYPTRDPKIGFHALPIALYQFKDGLFVRAADAAHASLVGSRVVSIGGVKVDEAYARTRPYVGRDNEMGAKFWSMYLLAIPEMLHVMGLAPNIDSAQLDLEKNGARTRVWLKPSRITPMSPPDADASWWNDAGWVDARDNAGAPPPRWLSKNPVSVLWSFERIPGTLAGYAQINQVRNGPDESFDDFSLRLLQFVDTAKLDRLIIDLRLNRGGNGTLLRTLERGLLRRPSVNARGKLYVIMGRSTWSAAQFLLNDLAAFSEAIFVGEPSGSKGNSYGDSRQIKLPNSGITARASIFYWQDWHPNDSRPWIPPDIAAELTFADYAANRDPALTAALNDVPGPTLVATLRERLAAGKQGEALAAYLAFKAAPANSYAILLGMLGEVGIYFYNKKDLPKAVWAFALAADEFPRSIRAQLDVAAMYEATGEKSLERAALLRVLDLNPAHPHATTRLATLDKEN